MNDSLHLLRLSVISIRNNTRPFRQTHQRWNNFDRSFLLCGVIDRYCLDAVKDSERKDQDIIASFNQEDTRAIDGRYSQERVSTVGVFLTVSVRNWRQNYLAYLSQFEQMLGVCPM